MYDAGKIVAGLAVFLVLVTVPVWMAALAGETPRAPELRLPAGESQCVEPAAVMRATHMELLNTWRDRTVRSDDRFITLADGRRMERSLSRTCLGCHETKDAFCDRCHDYLAVSPYCWDCHVVPQGAGVAAVAGGGAR